MTTQPTELIRLDNVGVSYPQRGGLFKRTEYWALKDISFGICEGETIGVIGRNGVGKTTLLRLLADIISPDRGSVTRAPGRRTVLLSIQAGFIPTLTGRQNALISGITLGLSKDKIINCFDQIIEFSELHEFIDQPVASYSSGMRARLGFSVAMQVDPDILLIDEAISVGDEVFRKKSSAVIRERVAANETTILVTHNAQMASTLCTRIIWIEDGVVRMSGDPQEIMKLYLGK
ncbi:MAG: ABC transporter ATP-binding protein [Nitrosomonadales bacterium]|nr:ABC transporter ATP-binding protein [Nitrosomonadales bacterium]